MTEGQKEKKMKRNEDEQMNELLEKRGVSRYLFVYR